MESVSYRRQSLLPVEAEVVLCCARPVPAHEATPRALELIDRVRDWDLVARIAQAQGVHPLVFSYLDAVCAAQIPDAALAKLRREFQRNLLHNRLRARELVRIVRLLDEAGIESLALKGPVLAEMAYGSIAMRQFTDLDLLVRKSTLERVAEILGHEGYASALTRREGLQSGYFQEFEDCFWDVKGIGPIDVHWRLTPKSFPFAIADESVWRRAQTVTLETGGVRTLAAADLLLYVCVHGAKHGFRMLGWICDVAAILRGCQPIDLDSVLAEAAKLGSRRMVMLGIYLAHRMVAAPLPSQVVAEARADRVVVKLAIRAERALFRRLDGQASMVEPWAIPLGTIESARARIAYCVGRLLAPTMGDFEMLPLPERFFPLYWLIRPFRMAAQWGPRVVRDRFGAGPVGGENRSEN